MAKEPKVVEAEEAAAEPKTLYVFPVDLEVTGTNGLGYEFKAGVPRELPPCAVEAALAAGVQPAQ